MLQYQLFVTENYLHTFLVVETKKEVAEEELKVVYINPHSYFSGKTPKGDPILRRLTDYFT